MEIDIRIVKPNEFNQVINLLRKSINKYMTSICTEDNKKALEQRFLNKDRLKNRFNSKSWYFYGAFIKDKLIGILIGNNHYIELFFIEEDYQGLGIGNKLLFEFLKDKNNIGIYSLNSAISFYKKMGFISIGEEKNEKGMKITPMVQQNEKANISATKKKLEKYKTKLAIIQKMKNKQEINQSKQNHL